MSFRYKLRLRSTSSLSLAIKEKTSELSESRKLISKLNKDIFSSFEDLKKAKAKLTRFTPQETKLKKRDTALIDTDLEKKTALVDISSSIIYNIFSMLKEIDNIVESITKIILDADTILYRESKALDKMYMKVNGKCIASSFSSSSFSSSSSGSGKTKKSSELLFSEEINKKLMLVKEDLKTAARRLYESLSAEKAIKKPFKKRKTILSGRSSDKIKRLSLEAGQLENMLEILKINNIDEITKDAEKELKYLEKIELAMISVVPEIYSYFSKIRSKLYLLDDSFSARVLKKLEDSEKKLERSVFKMSSDAESILKEIVIFKEIKNK